MNDNIYKKIPLIDNKDSLCPICQSHLLENQYQKVYGYLNDFSSKKVAIVPLYYCQKCKTAFCDEDIKNYSSDCQISCFYISPNNKQSILYETYSYPKEYKTKQKQLSFSNDTFPDFSDELVDPIIFASSAPDNVLSIIIYELPDLAPDYLHIACITTDTVYYRYYSNNDRNIYKASDAFVKMLEKALLFNCDTFIFQGIKRKIYYCFYSKQFRNRINGIRDLENATFNKPVNIFVHKLKGAFCSKNHTLEIVTAKIISARSNSKKTISVYYCYECNEYFINQAVYQEFCKSNGLPPIKMISPTKNKLSSDSFYDNLSLESELHMYGYHVSGELKNKQFYRIRILEDVIDTGLMKKADVINHIERLIYRNKSKKDAIERWKSDLDYVRSYKENYQRIVWGEFNT